MNLLGYLINWLVNEEMSTFFMCSDALCNDLDVKFVT